MGNDSVLPAGTAPIMHRKKADLVTDYLREQIINGTYNPGQRMPLADLARDLGLSHMPVREALLRLEREGLVVGEPHKGMRVADLSLEDAKELFEIRCELEGLAAMRACASGDARLPDDLAQINRGFADAYARSDFTAMGEQNWAFHRRILAAARSGQLARLLEDVWTRSFRFRLGYRLIPGRAGQTINEHARIIEAIRSGDDEESRQSARAHIQQAWLELARAVDIPAQAERAENS